MSPHRPCVPIPVEHETARRVIPFPGHFGERPRLPPVIAPAPKLRSDPIFVWFGPLRARVFRGGGGLFRSGLGSRARA